MKHTEDGDFQKRSQIGDFENRDPRLPADGKNKHNEYFFAVYRMGSCPRNRSKPDRVSKTMTSHSNKATNGNRWNQWKSRGNDLSSEIPSVDNFSKSYILFLMD